MPEALRRYFARVATCGSNPEQKRLELARTPIVGRRCGGRFFDDVRGQVGCVERETVFHPETEELPDIGELDPVISMDGLRDEDIELANIREFFSHWMEYDLDLDAPYLTTTIIEEAVAVPPANYWGPREFKPFLLRVAAARGDPGKISADRLGLWLRRISGRIVTLPDAQGTPRKYRLIREQDRLNRACFRLVELP